MSKRFVPSTDAEADYGRMLLMMETFGRNLAKAMADKGMSHDDLALKLWGTAVDLRGETVIRRVECIAKYVDGDVLPDPEVLLAIAEALDTTVEALGINSNELMIELATK